MFPVSPLKVRPGSRPAADSTGSALLLYALRIVMLALMVLTARSAAEKNSPDNAIEFRDLDGRLHRLTGNENQRATVMIFISRECPISNYFQPTIRELTEKYAARRVGFFVVYADADITDEQARQHRDAYDIRAWVVTDPEHRLVKFARAGVTPEVFIWSNKGKLLYRGRIDDTFVALGKKRARATSSDLRNALDDFLAGRKIKISRTRAVGCYVSH